MPYITKAERELMENRVIPPNTAGQLNYAITRLIQKYLTRNPRYQTFNDVIGALEAAKLELYRRMVAPYEDKKAKQNGDVYGKKGRKKR